MKEHIKVEGAILTEAELKAFKRAETVIRKTYEIARGRISKRDGLEHYGITTYGDGLAIAIETKEHCFLIPASSDYRERFNYIQPSVFTGGLGDSLSWDCGFKKKTKKLIIATTPLETEELE